MNTEMKIVSINISDKKGVPKKQISKAQVVVEHGLADDAHAGPWHRQISLLAEEEINAAKEGGLDVSYGDFAENITTRGVDWPSIPVGTRFFIGNEVELEITQIGKKCHTKCAIYQQAGDCIMPRKGVFAKVISGGTIKIGDPIKIIE